VFGYLFKDRVGQSVFGTNTHHLEQPLINIKSGEEIEISLHFTVNMGAGTYSVAVALHADASHIGQNYEWRDHALVFSVLNNSHQHFLGVNWLPPQIEIDR
jgi:lipopolysaccharide transport system ATP-binding protein